MNLAWLKKARKQIINVSPKKLFNLTKKSWWKKKQKESKIVPQKTETKNETIETESIEKDLSVNKPKKTKKTKVGKMNRDDIRNILLFNDKLDGENWTKKEGWRSFLPIKQWYGCVVVERRITELCLSNNLLKVCVLIYICCIFYLRLF